MPSILIAAFVAIAPALTYAILTIVYRRLTSPWRYIPGPKSSFILGAIGEVRHMQSHEIATYFANTYGHVLKYDSFGIERLYTTDIQAISHILNNGYEYQRPESQRWFRRRMTTGDGLLTTEGEQHRRQRKAMNLAFGTTYISRLTEIFVTKAIQLRTLLEKECDQNSRKVEIDSVDWLRRVTLDIIGLAGFNRDFEALGETSDKSRELHEAFIKSHVNVSAFTMLKGLIPAMRILPDFDEEHKIEPKKLRIGQRILEESRVASLNEKGSHSAARDILSLLVKGNLSDKENQRMTDRDVVAQIATFVIAGHETTSTSTSWALYALCLDKRIQTKLRDELLSVQTDTPTMDELNSLTYLDHVVKETMRYHSPVAFVPRVAAKDDLIPLGKPYTDLRGIQHSSIPIKKGQEIEIPVLAVNIDKSLWGEDAMEFKPERWDSLPKDVGAIPGVWSNMLSFVSGAHSCIGFRFSVVEMKAILYTLIRAFELELAVGADEIARTRAPLVTPRLSERPYLKSDATHRVQLPLFITPVSRSE